MNNYDLAECDALDPMTDNQMSDLFFEVEKPITDKILEQEWENTIGTNDD